MWSFLLLTSTSAHIRQPRMSFVVTRSFELSPRIKSGREPKSCMRFVANTPRRGFRNNTNFEFRSAWSRILQLGKSSFPRPGRCVRPLLRLGNTPSSRLSCGPQPPDFPRPPPLLLEEFCKGVKIYKPLTWDNSKSENETPFWIGSFFSLEIRD